MKTLQKFAINSLSFVALCVFAHGQENHRLIYNPDDGKLTLEVPESVPTLTTLELRSRSGIFSGERPSFLSGQFELFGAGKIFRLAPEGFGTTEFGPVIPVGIDPADLGTDLCVNGSLSRGGLIGEMTVGFGERHFPITGCELFPAPHQDRHPIDFRHDERTGSVSLVVDGGPMLSSFLIGTDGSAAFTGTPAESLNGDFDVLTNEKIFKFNVDGFRNLDLGPVLTPGVDFEASSFCGIAISIDGSTSSVAFDGGVLSQCGSPLPIDVEQEFQQPTLPVSPPPASANVAYHLTYEPETGNLLFGIPDGLPDVTAFEITSKSGVFTAVSPDQLTGLFDVYAPNKLFRLVPTGFGETDFGPAIAPGLSVADLAADLCLSGARISGGSISGLISEGDSFTPLTGCPARPTNQPHRRNNHLDYDNATGELALHITDDTQLTSVLIESRDGLFSGAVPETLTGSFDILDSNRLFKMDVDGFSDVDFGAILPANLGELGRGDLCVTATRLEETHPVAIYLGNRRLLACDSPEPQTNAPNYSRPNSPQTSPPPGFSPGLVISYNPATGDLIITSDAPFTTLEIQSEDGSFEGDAITGFDGLFDVVSDEKLFTLNPAGLFELNLPGVLPEGLEDFTEGLTVDGSFLAGGAIDFVFQVDGVLIPETASHPIAVVALLFLLTRRQRKLG